MENYEIISKIGEGTYGVVLKARHKETGQFVAIKKIKESDKDEQVRKTALREVRILKQLKHDNIVMLIEVFRRKGKLHLVFEFVDRTILEDLERNPEGLPEVEVKKTIYQLIKSIEFCHSHNVIHRDIKPENLLISKNGVMKLCDFGFARNLAGPGAKYTDYVSTRWYRSPELLIGDTSYGKAVDIWAIGCMVAELCNGLPLFPGESDIDQLFHIVQCLGKLNSRMMEIMRKNPLFVGVQIPEFSELEPLEKKLPKIDDVALDFLKSTLYYEQEHRSTCAELLSHPFFEGFEEWFKPQLLEAIEKDNAAAMVKKKRRHKDKDRERRTSGASVLPLTKSTSFPGGIGGALDELDDARTPDKPLLIPTELSTSSMMSTGSALDGDVSAPPSTRVGSKMEFESLERERDLESIREKKLSETADRRSERDRELEARERERLQSRDRKRTDAPHLNPLRKEKERRGHGAHSLAEKEVDDGDAILDRRHLPNLQAQRMVAFPVLAADADVDDTGDTAAFRRRIKDNVLSTVEMNRLLPTVRELKPLASHTLPSTSLSSTAGAAVVAGTAAVMSSTTGSTGPPGPSAAPPSTVAAGGSMIIGGAGGPSNAGARHARHSSHGLVAGGGGPSGQTAYRPAGYGFQPTTLTTKPPAYRVGQIGSYAPLTKPPSRGGARGSVQDGLLAPPRTQESGGGFMLRGTGAPLGAASHFTSSHFAGAGVKLL